jgi:hypothetical protein
MGPERPGGTYASVQTINSDASKGAYLTKQGKVTDGLVLLYSNAHSHVAHGVQEQEMPCSELCLSIFHTAQAYCCVIFVSLNC